MKKILIYQNENAINPIGGPAGYLYSLKRGLDSIEYSFEIDFLPAAQNENAEVKQAIKESSNKIIKSFLKLYREMKHLKMCIKILGSKITPRVSLKEYDIIHFHRTLDMYRLRDQLKEYTGKVILTSHSPQPLANEIIDGASAFEKVVLGKKLEELNKMDEYAFKRADYVIFPCEYADESYLHAWDEYKNIKSCKGQSYRYLLTGTVPATVKRDKETVRKSLGIPSDAFVLCYVGRHNEIKGYDKLKLIGEKILEKYPNAYIMAAGNLGPIKPMKHDRWIEIGWTNDPHSYIGASDIFVLPNKETYFDLVLLEVLSIGIPVIASRTGGNKWFNKEEGVFLYDTEIDAIDLIEKIMEKDDSAISKLTSSNIKCYQENFTPEVFARDYLKIIDEILYKNGMEI